MQELMPLTNKTCPKGLGLFLFAFPALWNAGPIPPGSAKRNSEKSSVNWSPVEFRVAELPKAAFHWASSNERSEWAVR